MIKNEYGILNKNKTEAINKFCEEYKELLEHYKHYSLKVTHVFDNHYSKYQWVDIEFIISPYTLSSEQMEFLIKYNASIDLEEGEVTVFQRYYLNKISEGYNK